MTDTMTTFHMTGDMNKLLIADIHSLHIPAKPRGEEAVVAERLASDAWCAWWIERNGDAGVKVTSDQGKLALESLAAFHAGWEGSK